VPNMERRGGSDAGQSKKEMKKILQRVSARHCIRSAGAAMAPRSRLPHRNELADTLASQIWSSSSTRWRPLSGICALLRKM